jgi:hypothetical protein
MLFTAIQKMYEAKKFDVTCQTIKSIAKLGIDNAGVRDEIFVQLCRQLTLSDDVPKK